MIECGPSPSGVAGVKLQVPAASVIDAAEDDGAVEDGDGGAGLGGAGEGRRGVVGGVAVADRRR